MRQEQLKTQREKAESSRLRREIAIARREPATSIHPAWRHLRERDALRTAGGHVVKYEKKVVIPRPARHSSTEGVIFKSGSDFVYASMATPHLVVG